MKVRIFIVAKESFEQLEQISTFNLSSNNERVPQIKELSNPPSSS